MGLMFWREPPWTRCGGGSLSRTESMGNRQWSRLRLQWSSKDRLPDGGREPEAPYRLRTERRTLTPLTAKQTTAASAATNMKLARRWAKSAITAPTANINPMILSHNGG